MRSERVVGRAKPMMVLAPLFFAGSSLAQPPSPTPLCVDWRMAARSDVIVRARVSVPVKAIEEALKAGPKEYVSVRLSVLAILKGTPTAREIACRYYPNEVPYQPAPRAVLSLDGREALVCLVQVGSPPEVQFYSDDSPRSLVAFDKDEADRIAEEVTNQQRITRDFAKLPLAKPDEHAVAVQALIARMRNKETELEAFRDLEAMGRHGVPSTIRLMNDFHPLPIRQISLENKYPGAFEGMRHYGPELVVDALDAILGQVTGENFGAICNGGTDRERRATIDGWRTYLYYGCPKHP